MPNWTDPPTDHEGDPIRDELVRRLRKIERTDEARVLDRLVRTVRILITRPSGPA